MLEGIIGCSCSTRRSRRPSSSPSATSRPAASRQVREPVGHGVCAGGGQPARVPPRSRTAADTSKHWRTSAASSPARQHRIDVAERSAAVEVRWRPRPSAWPSSSSAGIRKRRSWIVSWLRARDFAGRALPRRRGQEDGGSWQGCRKNAAKPEHAPAEQAEPIDVEAELASLKALEASLHAARRGGLIFLVDAAAVAKVVADWTGIPTGRMIKNEIENVLKLAQQLGRRVMARPCARADCAPHSGRPRGPGKPGKPSACFCSPASGRKDGDGTGAGRDALRRRTQRDHINMSESRRPTPSPPERGPRLRRLR